MEHLVILADVKLQRMRSVEECKSPRRRRVHYKSESDDIEDNLSLHSAVSTLSLDSEADGSVQDREMVSLVPSHMYCSNKKVKVLSKFCQSYSTKTQEITSSGFMHIFFTLAFGMGRV